MSGAVNEPKLGAPIVDRFPSLPAIEGSPPEAVYRYTDEDGVLLYVQTRYPGKRFQPFRLEGGRWIWNLDGVERVLYRLPEVAAHLAAGNSKPLHICEGEKDADTLAARGECATWAFGGSGAPVEQYADYLTGARRIVVHADNDEAGRGLARRWLAALGGLVDQVEAVLPALDADKADVADHLEAGFGLDDFRPLEVELQPAVEVIAARATRELVAVPVEQFAQEHEASAEPLLGSTDEMALAAGGTIMFYGDGGTSKTTLSIDGVLHSAAGDDWLSLAVPKPLRVLVIENEGPRGPFRAKLKRKLASWEGSAFEGRVHVLEQPWAGFSFADEEQRAQLAALCAELEIDLIVCGPLAALGAIGGGTPDEVSAFEALLRDLRNRLERPLALWLVHHENKAGDVSGAWERLPDTMVHVRLEGRGQSLLHWRKARWSSALHGARWTLAWAIEREGFELVDEEAKAAAKTAEIEDARAWLAAYVVEHPGESKTALETAYAKVHGKGGRALARAAIEQELTASTPQLAVGPGKSPNGTYLYLASEANSPTRQGVLGEYGELESDPLAGRQLANSPSPRRG